MPKNKGDIPFDEVHVKYYLDLAIQYWRDKRDNEGSEIAEYYIDAFQCMRSSFFGGILSK